MSIPLLKVTPTTQNQRVAGYEVPDEDDPILYRGTDATSSADVDQLIWAAYRQIFGEHLILESSRQPFLESQLRNRAISVREFIRGLGKSEVYRRLVVETNSNYRLVDITFKRFLGRATYGKDEQIAWSIVIATKGFDGFVDAVVDSEEYSQNFGQDIVPFQRRRFNERPFNLVNPRYGSDWRDTESVRAGGSSYYQIRQPGMSVQEAVRRAVPSYFFSMANGILPNERNYQRTVASVSAQVQSLEIPDTSRTVATPEPAVGRTGVALPYRYLYKTPQA